MPTWTEQGVGALHGISNSQVVGRSLPLVGSWKEGCACTHVHPGSSAFLHVPLVWQNF